MNYARVFLLLASSVLFAQDSPYLMEVHISPRWMRDNVVLPGSESFPIPESEGKFKSSGTGTAVTNTRLVPSLSNDSLSIQLVSDVQVCLPPHVSGPVTRRVQVQFDSQFSSTVRGQKAFWVQETGIAKGETAVCVGPVATSFSNVEATRTRVLTGRQVHAPLITAFAPRSIPKQLAEKVPEVSSTLKEKIKTGFEQTFATFEQQFGAFFLEPIVKKEFLGGPVKFFSGTNALGFEVVKKGQVAVLRSELSSDAEPVVLRITSELLEELSEQRFAGIQVTNLELGMLIVADLSRPTKPDQIVRQKDEALMTFAATKPMQFIFKDNHLYWKLSFATVELDGVEYPNVQIGVTYNLLTDQNGDTVMQADHKVELVGDAAGLDNEKRERIKRYLEKGTAKVDVRFAQLKLFQKLPGKLKFGKLLFNEGASRVSFKVQP